MKQKFILIAILLLSGCSTNRTAPQSQEVPEKNPSFVVASAESKYAVPEADKKKYVSFGLSRDKEGVPDHSFYLVKTSLVRKGDVAEGMILSNSEKGSLINGKTVLSTVLYMDFDCKNMRQSRITRIDSYTLPFAKGDRVGTVNTLENGSATWDSQKFDSFGGRFIRSACYLTDKNANSKKPPPENNAAATPAGKDSFLAALKDEERKIAALKAKTARSSASGGQAPSYLSLLKNKIRSNMILPAGIEGNPVSKFRITQLPSGEVLNVELIQSSGNKQLDVAVERAIRKSSPLPVPTDREPDRVIEITYIPF